MTQRHDKVPRILVQAIHIHTGQKIIKSFTDNYVNWNKRIKLPQEIQKIKREVKNEKMPEIYRMRPDIWFYRIENSHLKHERDIFFVT
jgi:hypothetical protein